MNEQLKAGFTYTVEVLDREGNVVDADPPVKNLMPSEGVAHLVNGLVKSGAQVGTWYIGLLEGNYTPTANDTAATLPAAGTECTAYSASTRVAFVPGTLTGGTVDNGSSKAEFTLSADKTVYGGFISSASAKGSTSGVLLSVVRFGAPKILSAGSTMRVTAGLALVSA